MLTLQQSLLAGRFEDVIPSLEVVLCCIFVHQTYAHVVLLIFFFFRVSLCFCQL